MAHQWRRADEQDKLIHCPNHQTKNIFYARIYTPRAGFEHSETNRYIHNLKIHPQESHRLRYKQEAIKTFAHEVSGLFKKSAPVKAFLIPIPPSKTVQDVGYDDRLEQVCVAVAKQCANVSCLPLVKRTHSVEPSHLRNDERRVEDLYQSLTVDEQLAHSVASDAELVLLDDVITSGAQFEACRRLLLEIFPKRRITGLFWAKARVG